jgi:hypothetical protein
VSDAAQANITSVGILTSLSVSGNVTASRFNGSGAGLTAIPGGNITGIVASATSADTAAVVTNGAQANITSVGVLTSLSVSGNVTAGRFNGSGAGLTAIPGANITGAVSSASTATTANSVAGANVTGTVASATTATSATTAGTVTTAAQDNITSVGILTSLSVSGAITAGGGIVNGQANGVGNIGSASTYFNTVFAQATSAQYADLAEKYQSDSNYAPGTVVVFGDATEITISTEPTDARVAGVVTSNPAYLMNAGLEHGVAVTLTGRVPCQVVGEIRRGDMLVTSAMPGVATAAKSPAMGTVIGKALEHYNNTTPGVIEVVVGRL